MDCNNTVWTYIVLLCVMPKSQIQRKICEKLQKVKIVPIFWSQIFYFSCFISEWNTRQSRLFASETRRETARFIPNALYLAFEQERPRQLRNPPFWNVTEIDYTGHGEFRNVGSENVLEETFELFSVSREISRRAVRHTAREQPADSVWGRIISVRLFLLDVVKVQESVQPVQRGFRGLSAVVSNNYVMRGRECERAVCTQLCIYRVWLK